MSAQSPAGFTPTECVRLLVEHRQRWMVPTVVCAMLSTVFALLMTRYWQADHALVVRHEVSSSSTGQPGDFADLFEMRTFQETMLELVKSRQVISATLQAVAQTESGSASVEPTEKAVAAFRKRLSMSPPGGAEFGKTEVFYLGVRDKNRERAIRSVAELSRQLDLRLRQLRNDQAQSVIGELEKQVELANASHQVQTHELEEFESQVGSDLGELRMLHGGFSGQSDLRQQAVALENESRNAAARVREAEQLLVVLQTAQQNPEQLVAMPNSLLTSQPTLRRLKDGMVDAQLRAAQLGGTRTAKHPQVLAANEAVQHIRSDLHNELKVAIQGVEIELGLSRGRSTDLQTQLQQVQNRLAKLALHRAEYSNRVSALQNSRTVLDHARKQLNEARAEQVAASSASLVAPIDRPDAGTHPIGMGRTSVLMLGTLGGLILGLGWTFLTVSPTADMQMVDWFSAHGMKRQSVATEGMAKAEIAFPEGVTVAPYKPEFTNGMSESTVY